MDSNPLAKRLLLCMVMLAATCAFPTDLSSFDLDMPPSALHEKVTGDRLSLSGPAMQGLTLADVRASVSSPNVLTVRIHTAGQMQEESITAPRGIVGKPVVSIKDGIVTVSAQLAKEKPGDVKRQRIQEELSSRSGSLGNFAQAEKGVMNGIRHAEHQLSRGFGRVFNDFFGANKPHSKHASDKMRKNMKEQLDAQAHNA
eukprot:TRINITY_DN5957_c0_g1_i3.p1 TRINITY_DN5957_c0_g1~~TRINITY_DN5957_c0_g1_i3.p1  ORF type:complete len:200 (+),score=51.65 TRINITY_DN5957_c0_g1_i3:247-846(+)